MTTPEISIVIPAFNEAENLAELLGVLNAVASGLKPGSLESDGGTAASATSEYLPASALDQLIVGLCSQAGAIVSTVPISGTLIYENQTWGTRAAPELRCIDGLTDPGDSVTL
ncbi:MAG: hypothetical protein FJ143_03905, partial [Deltaproteobacteria bacterium]|nr:hypothetical protein [Deltaproteobacteria bacterium]